MRKNVKRESAEMHSSIKDLTDSQNIDIYFLYETMQQQLNWL